MEVSGQLHSLAALRPGRAPGTHCIGGWVDNRTGLDKVENRRISPLPGLELRLYRLRYPRFPV
jgi:hypothetical protein